MFHYERENDSAEWWWYGLTPIQKIESLLVMLCVNSNVDSVKNLLSMTLLYANVVKQLWAYTFYVLGISSKFFSQPFLFC